MDFFKGRVAIVTGSSRGIGREIVLKLASLGCHVVVAAKSTTPQPTLPGTIFTVRLPRFRLLFGGFDTLFCGDGFLKRAGMGVA